jgi:hypothetical protein
MSEHKPLGEWDCPETAAKAFEELEAMKIELDQKQNELQEMAQRFGLKNTESWNAAREYVANLGDENKRSVYTACHLRFDREKKTIIAYQKGQCPLCEEESQEAVRRLNSGTAIGLAVTGGEGKPTHQGGVADPGQEIMREERKKKGRRGMFSDEDNPPESN